MCVVDDEERPSRLLDRAYLLPLKDTLQEQIGKCVALCPENAGVKGVNNLAVTSKGTFA